MDVHPVADGEAAPMTPPLRVEPSTEHCSDPSHGEDRRGARSRGDDGSSTAGDDGLGWGALDSPKRGAEVAVDGGAINATATTAQASCSGAATETPRCRGGWQHNHQPGANAWWVLRHVHGNRHAPCMRAWPCLLHIRAVSSGEQVCALCLSLVLPVVPVVTRGCTAHLACIWLVCCSWPCDRGSKLHASLCLSERRVGAAMVPSCVLALPVLATHPRCLDGGAGVHSVSVQHPFMSCV